MKFLCCQALCRSRIIINTKDSTSTKVPSQIYRRLSLIRKDAIFGEAVKFTNELTPTNYNKDNE